MDVEKEFKKAIENEVYTTINLILESAFYVDRLGNLVYQNGARESVKHEIESIIDRWMILANTCKFENISIVDILKRTAKGYASEKCNVQKQELINILNEIEQEQKESKDDDEKNPNSFQKDKQMNAIWEGYI